MMERRKEDWMARNWRPFAAVTYMVICIADFVVFPIVWSGALAALKMPITQWNPITLQGAGLLHISFGAILGVSAFGRTKEKIFNAELSAKKQIESESN